MSTFRRAAIGIVAVATGLATAGLMSAASAAVTSTSVTATSQPSIASGGTNQPAGDFTITETGGSVSIGDTITLTVADSATNNCATTGDTLGFTATPTVTVTSPATGAPTFSASTSSTGAACITGNVKNTLTLTATASGSAATLTVSGVHYDVGAAVPSGGITVTPGGSGTSAPACSGSCSDAKVTTALVTANNPPSALIPGTGEAVSNFVITESQKGAVPGGFVCFAINSGNATFTASNTPTVTASGGGAAAGSPAATSPTQESFQVTTASSSGPATYTLGSIKFDTTAAGPVTFNTGTGGSAALACTNAGASPTLGSNTVAALVLTVNRLSGLDRFDTARVVAEKTFTCTGGATANRFAIVARGDAFPDALAGAFLAGLKGAPILLTDTNSVPSSTTSALRQLGINQVIVLGAQSAISDAVVNQLKGTQAYDCAGTPATTGSGPLDITVQRIGGTDRYQTAREVAEAGGLNAAGTLSPNGTPGTPEKTAILADGLNFPDALAAAPIAYTGSHAGNGSGGLPLLLTDPSTLSPDAQQGISDLSIKQVIIPGGNSAVSPAVEATLTTMGVNVIRFAGTDRNDTAAKIATFETATPAAGPPTVGGLGYSVTSIDLARGDDFADALAGGPSAGISRTPILLTASPTVLSAPTTAYLHANGAVVRPGGITALTVFGGTSAVADSVVQAAEAALAGAS